jgi:HSF-type DNA-binding
MQLPELETNYLDSQEEEADEDSKIFPQRLMEILHDSSNHDSIAWLPHGKSFIIVDRQKFCNSTLPKYFRKTKFTSFTRKLNRWNFSRVTRGPEIGAYYNEFFRKDNEALCTQMYCKNDRAKFAVAANTKNPSDKHATKKQEKALKSKGTDLTLEVGHSFQNNNFLHDYFSSTIMRGLEDAAFDQHSLLLTNLIPKAPDLLYRHPFKLAQPMLSFMTFGQSSSILPTVEQSLADVCRNSKIQDYKFAVQK